ncbi:hypothetical protein [Chitinimonas sp.]|uniref:hypothetical protein n=1 Tax=Chitinimonas sp. TaxID=1934313 RepID=UPI0035B47CC1
MLDVDAGAAGTYNFSCEMTGLSCNKLYRYHFAGSHTTAGSAEHSNTNTTNTSLYFYTTPCAPGAGSNDTLTQTSASVSRAINKGGLAQTMALEWGTTTAYGNSGTITANGTVPAGSSGTTTVTASITGLTCNTTYHYRFNATTDDGAVNGSTLENGTDQTFTTAACGPTVTTGASSSITTTGATLAGTVNDNSLTVSAISFELGTTTAYGQTVSATPSSLSSGAGSTAISGSATGLSCNTSYHYRLTATVASVAYPGSDQTFTTSACPVAGVCGSADGATLESIPSAGLCASGNAGSVGGSGPWSWVCSGLNGGGSSSCSTAAPLPTGGKNLTIGDGATVVVTSNNQGGSQLSIQDGATVTLDLGNGNKVKLTTTASNTQIKFDTIMVNGVNTPVIRTVSGGATVSNATGGKVLLAVGDKAVTSCTDASSTTLALSGSNSGTDVGVVTGCLILPANSLASNQFAALTDNKVLAGEAVFIDSVDKVTRVRLGTIGDNSSLAGDRVSFADQSASSIFNDAKIPNLNGSAVRLGGGKTLKQRVFEAAGLDPTLFSANQWGVFTIPSENPEVAEKLPYVFRPIGDILIDTSLPDGFSNLVDGRVRYVTGGLQLFFAPAVNQPYRPVTQGRLFDQSIGATVQNDGSYRVQQLGGLANNGVEFVLRPAWRSAPDSRVGIFSDANGYVSYHDGASRTLLLPVAADTNALYQAARTIDPAASIKLDTESGHLIVTVLNQVYRLLPNYLLQQVPADKANLSWWLDGANHVVIKNRDGTAQSFLIE